MLLSVAILDQRPPKNPLSVEGRVMSGSGSSLKDADKSVLKNASRISSARTTILKLHIGDVRKNQHDFML